MGKIVSLVVETDPREQGKERGTWSCQLIAPADNWMTLLKSEGNLAQPLNPKCNSCESKEIMWLDEGELLTVINAFKCHFCRSFSSCYLLANRLVVNYGATFCFKNHRSTVYFSFTFRDFHCKAWKPSCINLITYSLFIVSSRLNPSFLWKHGAFVRAVKWVQLISPFSGRTLSARNEV